MHYAIVIMALLGTVLGAANQVPDLGKGDWWIYKEDWSKYRFLKDGKRIYTSGCKFRIGSADNVRPNASGDFKWKDANSGDRILMVKRNNPRSNWVNFKKQSDGSYKAGRAGRQWKIWNKSNPEFYGGTISKCAHESNVFKAAKEDFKDVLNSVPDEFFDKCGSGVSDACKEATIPMTEEGW
jgi:hypothetical protein